jgi:hypothetical protein
LAPDLSLPENDRLKASLDSFFDYLEARPYGCASIPRGGEDTRITAALKAGRAEQLARLIEALTGWEQAPASTEPSPALETALQGWLFFCEGAVLRWLKRDGLEREELRTLLRKALEGALLAAAAVDGAPGADSGQLP